MLLGVTGLVGMPLLGAAGLVGMGALGALDFGTASVCLGIAYGTSTTKKKSEASRYMPDSRQRAVWWGRPLDVASVGCDDGEEVVDLGAHQL